MVVRLVGVLLLLNPHSEKAIPTIAFQMPSVGVPASPSSMWTKARSERGALIRLCGDGVVSTEARNGVILHGNNNQPLCTQQNGPFRPTTTSRCPPLVFPPRHGCGQRPEANEVHWFVCTETGWCRMRRETGLFCMEIPLSFCTQKRTVPTHNRVPDAHRWCSRLAMDVDEPLPLTKINGPSRPTTALRVRKDGVPASPWMWANARSKPGSVMRLCGDGVMPNAAIMGVFCIELIMHPFHSQNWTVRTHHRTPGAQRWSSRMSWMWAKARSKLGAVVRLCRDGVMPNAAIMGSFLHVCMKSTPSTHRTGPSGPTTALRVRKDGLPASPWMWANARSQPGAVVRLCGDGVMPNAARMGVFCIEMHPFHLQK
jgi:hypothetical protein